MASTQSQSNTNDNTEWVTVVDNKQMNRTKPKPDLYQNTEFIEDDGIIFRSPEASGQSTLMLFALWFCIFFSILNRCFLPDVSHVIV